jgi:hypothetical protein
MNNYIRCIVPQSVVICVTISEFLVLTHNIPRTIISEKKRSKSEVMFMERTAAVICPHYLSEKK